MKVFLHAQYEYKFYHVHIYKSRKQLQRRSTTNHLEFTRRNIVPAHRVHINAKRILRRSFILIDVII